MIFENLELTTNLMGFNVNLLTDRQIEMLEKLEQYDLSFVEDRIRNKKLLREEVIPKAIEGFRRYIGLAALGHKNISVPCEAVDEVWHAFILYTKEYADFCNSICGHFIHHCPENSVHAKPSELSDNNTDELYRKYFGNSVFHYNEQLGNCSSGGEGGGGAGICQSEHACRPNT